MRDYYLIKIFKNSLSLPYRWNSPLPRSPCKNNFLFTNITVRITLTWLLVPIKLLCSFSKNYLVFLVFFPL